MLPRWIGLALITGIGFLVLNCGDPQELTSITITPSTETIGSSNIPVSQDAGIQVQLKAYGNYIHPPVTKDITDQVAWASNTPQLVAVNSTGLMTATGLLCGGALVSATVTTNSDSSGVSSSGADVVGTMTADVVCYTGSGSGGGGAEPVLTVNFSGVGTGTVTSSPSGFVCSTADISCVDSFPAGTTLTLLATPVSPSTFGGWSGGCTGTGNCVLLIQSNTTVTATFN